MPPSTASELPRAPALGGSFRAGASDLFFNSWRVVPANILVAVGLALVAGALLAAGPLAAVLVAAPVAVPLAGLFRLGAMATRGRDVNLSDVLDPVREAPGPILVAGLGFALSTVVLATNLVTGLLAGGVVPWVVATTAAWGLLAMLAFGFTFWPLAVDPARAGVPWPQRARIAALLLLAHPGRILAMTIALIAVLAVSTVIVAALATISIGFCALVACRYVLPAADRLEAMLARAPRR
ncbi:MAG TPA: hypothetical protein VFY23_16240 [Candidatus Limnocylindrales bacterium]|nr:hypothetical protein [Candidatus Limnocylindrales bacterium]